MLHVIALIVTLTAAGGSGGPGAERLTPHVVDTQYPTPDVVIASRSLYPEPGDAAPRLQTAIDAFAAIGGGVVFLAEGRYELHGPITIREGVTVRGDWAPPPGVHGTVLTPQFGRDDPDGSPAIEMERGTGLREVAIWYPEQRADAIAPYPWTIRTSPTVNGNNVTVRNVTLVNPYRAFDTGPEFNELHTLENVYGTPLNLGIRMDTTTDIGRLTGVHFAPRHWAESGLPDAPADGDARAQLETALQEVIAVDIGRSDWEYLYDLQIDGYGTGLRLREGAHGLTNAVLFASSFTRCGTALRIDGLNDVGLSATATRFEGVRHAVHATASYATVAQFHTCTFAGGDVAALLEGPGLLSFQGCTFETWDKAAIDVRDGGVTALDCDFAIDADHVILGEGARMARLLSNRTPAALRLINEAPRADVMTSSEPMAFAQLQTTRADYSAPDRRPPNRNLFVVTAYGADPSLDDNTAAFAAALDAARAAGGGTVYIPAGYYRFRGSLVVPSGVELRGIFDVPHHTVSGGSVLMPLHGAGEEGGEPFIQLEAESGLRGVTFWYPEQLVTEPVAYPWAVRTLGPHCWLIDVTMGNAWQGADLWTHDSTGHVVRYLAGAYIRRGLHVSKSAGDGWVEDLQMNPHYAYRIPADFPGADRIDHGRFGAFVDIQRDQLEAMVFGRCAREHINRNFLYAAYDAIAFLDDDGGAHARVVMQGTDTCGRCFFLDTVAPEGVEAVNAQLVPLGARQVGAVVTSPTFSGQAWLFNTQSWAGDRTAVLEGPGDVVIQQFNTVSGPIIARAGRSIFENGCFVRSLDTHYDFQGAAQARVTVSGKPGRPLNVAVAEKAQVRTFAGFASLRPDTLPESAKPLRIGAGPGDQAPITGQIAEEGGGVRDIAESSLELADAPDGGRALRFLATPAQPSHAFVYYSVAEEPYEVGAGFELRYRLHPVNEAGRHVAVDVYFTDGSTLRDMGLSTTAGPGAHPGQAKGEVGAWTELTIPLGGPAVGKTIRRVMVAYDNGNASDTAEAYVDGIWIGPSERAASYRVTAEPKGGRFAAPLRVRIKSPWNVGVRYTLDGTVPTATSPRYRRGIRLDEPGMYELRYRAEFRDGELGGPVFGELYTITEE